MKTITVKFNEEHKENFGINCEEYWNQHFSEIYEFLYDEKTTIEEFLKTAYIKCKEEHCIHEIGIVNRFVVVKKERSYFLEKDVLFYKLLNYLDIKDKITIEWVPGAITDYPAGEVCHEEGKEIGLRIYFNSNEKNHAGRPHFHVEDLNTNEKASIDIKTGDCIAGKIKNKKHKALKQYLEKNRKDFYLYWEQQTNGIHIIPGEI